MKKYNVGFIGLGNVGSKIANNILKNKNNLFIHDLNKKRNSTKKSEIENFKSKEKFDKLKPITKWERSNTLDC